MRYVLFTGLILAWIALSACAVTPSVPRAVTQPTNSPEAAVNQAVVHLTKAAELISGISFLVLICAVGGVVYSLVTLDKPLEHIGLIVAAVSGAGVVLSISGIFILPFAPYLVWGVAALCLAGAGYEAYVKFFAKKTVTPAVK